MRTSRQARRTTLPRHPASDRSEAPSARHEDFDTAAGDCVAAAGSINGTVAAAGSINGPRVRDRTGTIAFRTSRQARRTRPEPQRQSRAIEGSQRTSRGFRHSSGRLRRRGWLNQQNRRRGWLNQRNRRRGWLSQGTKGPSHRSLSLSKGPQPHASRTSRQARRTTPASDRAIEGSQRTSRGFRHSSGRLRRRGWLNQRNHRRGWLNQRNRRRGWLNQRNSSVPLNARRYTSPACNGARSVSGDGARRGSRRRRPGRAAPRRSRRSPRRARPSRSAGCGPGCRGASGAARSARRWPAPPFRRSCS